MSKLKRALVSLLAVVALALGGAAIAGATGGGSDGKAQDSPAVDNHADGESNDNGPAPNVSIDKAEHGESAHDADGSTAAEAAE
jgi:hypothetical protein